MSVFLLKLVACLGMLIDHIGHVLGESGWNILPYPISDMMRYIGRFVFPLFAFLLINGWKHTKNKQRYFSKLVLFALISQIPFTLATYSGNLGDNRFQNDFIFWGESYHLAGYGIISLFFMFSYWYFALEKKNSFSILWVGLASFLPALSLNIYQVWITVPHLNIFYTLALGLFVIYIHEQIVLKKRTWYEHVLLFFTVAISLIGIGIQADYSLFGVLLIWGLYTARQMQLLQWFVIGVWACLLYGILDGHWGNVLASMIGSLIILFYNGKKGPSIKWTFYLFYPAHLLVLGMINFSLKLKLL